MDKIMLLHIIVFYIQIKLLMNVVREMRFELASIFPEGPPN
jgi:hypothetical protein